MAIVCFVVKLLMLILDLVPVKLLIRAQNLSC